MVVMPDWMLDWSNAYNQWWHDHPVAFYGWLGGCIGLYALCMILRWRKERGH